MSFRLIRSGSLAAGGTRFRRTSRGVCRSSMRDVTIIGAGPAGCVAGILLARGGQDVTMIEQHRFPRDKVCGECLSALGIDVLTRVGLRDKVASLRPVVLDRAKLIAATGEEATLHLPHPMWGTSRAAMDALLLEAARAAGVRMMQ